MEIFESAKFFENQIEDSKENKPFLKGIVERIVDRVERISIILCHEIFDEVEAAMYLRLSDPYGKGRETVRNYALRSKKLSYHKIGRDGLVFLKSDLNKALKNFKIESFRDR